MTTKIFTLTAALALLFGIWGPAWRSAAEWETIARLERAEFEAAAPLAAPCAQRASAALGRLVGDLHLPVRAADDRTRTGYLRGDAELSRPERTLASKRRAFFETPYGRSACAMLGAALERWGAILVLSGALLPALLALFADGLLERRIRSAALCAPEPLRFRVAFGAVALALSLTLPFGLIPWALPVWSGAAPALAAGLAARSAVKHFHRFV